MYMYMLLFQLRLDVATYPHQFEKLSSQFDHMILNVSEMPNNFEFAW